MQALNTREEISYIGAEDGGGIGGCVWSLVQEQIEQATKSSNIHPELAK